jgi:hypothetical protein
MTQPKPKTIRLSLTLGKARKLIETSRERRAELPFRGQGLGSLMALIGRLFFVF